jgi:uncharacterized phage-associated protein
VKVVRDAFKQFGGAPITSRATRLVLQTGAHEPVPPRISHRDAAFVETIFLAYDGYGPWQLSEMTHEEGSPWDRLWNADEPVGRLGLRIKNEEIQEHFARIRTRFPVT